MKAFAQRLRWWGKLSNRAIVALHGTSVYTVSAEGCGPPCLVVSYNKPKVLRTYSKLDPHRISLVELFCFVVFFFQFYAFIISPCLKIKCFMTIGLISLFTREDVFPQFFNLSCIELLPSSAYTCKKYVPPNGFKAKKILTNNITNHARIPDPPPPPPGICKV